MKFPVVLGFGTMDPGKPSLLYPATDRKSSCPLGPPTSTLEPAMLPPPARSKQMNGILPAPVEMLHGPNKELMSPASVARAVRGAASIVRSEGPITVAEHVMKLCAKNSRRVRGRECSWRRSGSCNPKALDFLLIIKTSSIRLA